MISKIHRRRTMELPAVPTGGLTHHPPQLETTAWSREMAASFETQSTGGQAQSSSSRPAVILRLESSLWSLFGEAAEKAAKAAIRKGNAISPPGQNRSLISVFGELAMAGELLHV